MDWTTGGGKLCYRAAKEQGQPPTLVLSRKDGTLTANPREIHTLVEEVWVKGVFNRKDCSRPREDWDNFTEVCRKTIGGRSEVMQKAWEEYESRVKQEDHHEFKINKVDPHRLQIQSDGDGLVARP